MKIAGTPARRAGLIAAVAGLAAGVAVIAPTAQASQPAAAPAAPEAARQDASTMAVTLASRLGSRTAGAYVEPASGKIVVTVTDEAAAEQVRAAGGLAKRVTRTMAQLTSVTDTLARTARIPGTAWSVDPATNQVVVAMDSSVSGAKLRRMQTAVKALGGAVRVEQVPGTFTLNAEGGDPIFAGGARCSLGFNVRRGSEFFFLTAGHCGRAGTRWRERQSGQVIGTTESSSFPGDDYSLVRYAGTPTDRRGAVELYNGSTLDITSAANAVVGQRVQRSGSTTQVQSGQVTGLNATVNYTGGGTVSGLIRTSVCAEPGDSGGALFAGSTAIGLTSGGSGDCRGGRAVTFFQPVTEALTRFGVSVY